MQMVNAGFPERAWYGFEIVDAPAIAIPTRNADINRKFTPNQFGRIFRRFSAN
jgi:hypothetical protein